MSLPVVGFCRANGAGAIFAAPSAGLGLKRLGLKRLGPKLDLGPKLFGPETTLSGEKLRGLNSHAQGHWRRNRCRFQAARIFAAGQTSLDKNYIKQHVQYDEELRVGAALSDAGMRALVAGSFVQGELQRGAGGPC
jgi:hypothetical protein